MNGHVSGLDASSMLDATTCGTFPRDVFIPALPKMLQTLFQNCSDDV